MPSFSPSAPSSTRTTCDLRELLRLPFGTFGHEYAQWMIDHSLSPDVRVPADKPADPDQRYLLQRILQVHDFWHVLSGYNCDSAGELGLLAFTYGQSVARGIPLVLLGVVLEDLASNWRKRRRLWSPLVPYLWRAFRRGRRAHFLLPILVEDYLDLPIGAVRQRLGIPMFICSVARWRTASLLTCTSRSVIWWPCSASSAASTAVRCS